MIYLKLDINEKFIFACENGDYPTVKEILRVVHDFQGVLKKLMSGLLAVSNQVSPNNIEVFITTLYDTRIT